MTMLGKHTKKALFFWAVLLTTGVSTTMYSCDNKQASQEQDSNVGDEQSDLNVDTTASGGFGGTDNSTGRADADTSGTGRQMSADTTGR